MHPFLYRLILCIGALTLSYLPLSANNLYVPDEVCTGHFYAFENQYLEYSGSYIVEAGGVKGIQTDATLPFTITTTVGDVVYEETVTPIQSPDITLTYSEARSSVSMYPIGNISYSEDPEGTLAINGEYFISHSECRDVYFHYKDNETGCRNIPVIKTLCGDAKTQNNDLFGGKTCFADSGYFETTIKGATYKWDNGETTESIKVTKSDYYRVTVTPFGSTTSAENGANVIIYDYKVYETKDPETREIEEISFTMYSNLDWTGTSSGSGKLTKGEFESFTYTPSVEDVLSGRVTIDLYNLPINGNACSESLYTQQLELIFPVDDKVCKDYSLLDETANVSTEELHVCGCDNETYLNAEVAQKHHGVISYTPGKCEPSSIGSVITDDNVCLATYADVVAGYELAVADAYERFLWSTGETTRSITVSDTGFYSVTVADANNKGYREQIYVGVADSVTLGTYYDIISTSEDYIIDVKDYPDYYVFNANVSQYSEREGDFITVKHTAWNQQQNGYQLIITAKTSGKYQCLIARRSPINNVFTGYLNIAFSDTNYVCLNGNEKLSDASSPWEGDTVCGCNNVTYKSKDLAQKAGIGYYTYGACGNTQPIDMPETFCEGALFYELPENIGNSTLLIIDGQIIEYPYDLPAGTYNANYSIKGDWDEPSKMWDGELVVTPKDPAPELELDSETGLVSMKGVNKPLNWYNALGFSALTNEPEHSISMYEAEGDCNIWAEIIDEDDCPSELGYINLCYPEFNPFPSDTMCIEKYTELYADSGYDSYLWHTGHTSQMLGVSFEGLKKVTVYDATTDMYYSDSVYVFIKEKEWELSIQGEIMSEDPHLSLVYPGMELYQFDLGRDYFGFESEGNGTLALIEGRQTYLWDHSDFDDEFLHMHLGIIPSELCKQEYFHGFDIHYGTKYPSCFDANLIDASKIVAAFESPADSVCGCNNRSYRNADVARYAYGIPSYTKGACSPIQSGVQLFKYDSICIVENEPFYLPEGYVEYEWDYNLIEFDESPYVYPEVGAHLLVVTDNEGNRYADTLTVKAIVEPTIEIFHYPNIVAGEIIWLNEASSVDHFPVTYYATLGTNPDTYEYTPTAKDVENGGILLQFQTSNEYPSCESGITFLEYHLTTGDDPLPLSIEVDVEEPSFIGANDGAVSLTVSGGIKPYSYEWSTGAETRLVTGLPTGIYEVTITDNVGSFLIETIELNDPEPKELIAKLLVTEPSSSDAEDGELTVFVESGNPPYKYEWNVHNTGETLSGVGNGIYNVTITDEVGEELILTHTFKLQESLQVILTATDPLTVGGNEGAVLATVTGGVLPYTYLWSTTETDSSINNLPAGEYSVTVTDDIGTSVVKSVVLKDPLVPLLEATIYGENVTNMETPNGSAWVEVSGGVEPYEYEWNVAGNDAKLTNLPIGTYSVTVTDAIENTVQRTINIIDNSNVTELVIRVEHENVSIEGGANGSATVIVESGEGTYTYLWSTGSTETTIMDLIAGEYSVTVTDNNSSVVETVIIIEEIQSNPIEIEATIVHESVQTLADGSIELTITGNDGGFDLLWSTGERTTSIFWLAGGEYTVTVTDGISTKIETYIVETLIDLPTVNVEVYGKPLTNPFVQNGEAWVSVTSGEEPLSFEWSTGETVEHIYDLSAGTYTLTVIDKWGQSVESSVDIGIINEQLFPLEGTVKAADKLVDGAFVYAFLMQGGSVSASFKTETVNGAYYFDKLLPGSYVLLASVKNEDYAPSYYAKAYAWEDAYQLKLDAPVVDLDFNFIETKNTRGNTTIVGTISIEDSMNPADSVFSDLDGIPLLLISQNEVVANAVADENGMYSFTNIAPGEYSVVVNKPGNSIISTLVSVKEGDTYITVENILIQSLVTSIATIDPTFYVYPHPVYDIFSVKGDEIGKVQVLSMVGMVVFESGEKPQYNVSHLPHGVYVIKVSFKDGRVFISELIKQ